MIKDYRAKINDEILWTMIEYNGHYEWLKEYCDVLDELDDYTGDNYFKVCRAPIIDREYDDEVNFVWGLFVLMFGEYGTSPRSGWIERVGEFREYLHYWLKRIESEVEQ